MVALLFVIEVVVILCDSSSADPLIKEFLGGREANKTKVICSTANPKASKYWPMVQL